MDTRRARHRPAAAWSGAAAGGQLRDENVIYAMIARNWVEGRAGLLSPTVDMLVGGRRSLHLLELPLSAYLAGMTWKAAGGSLDAWGRATSIAFTAAAVAVLYSFVRRRHGSRAAIGAGGILAVAPVSIIYGQSFMLEASLVFFCVATVDAFDRWLVGGRMLWLLMTGLWLACMLLTKIYMLVMLLPLAGMLFASGQNLLSVSGFGRRARLGRCSGGRSDDLGRNGDSLRPRRVSAALGCTVLVTAALPALAWYYYVATVTAPGNPDASRCSTPCVKSARSITHPTRCFGQPVSTPARWTIWPGSCSRRSD